MTYAESSTRSNRDSRILVEFDIGQNTVQWVNAGAGIWLCDFDNVYDSVDSSLMPAAWTEIDATNIGTLQVDALPYTQVTALADVTTTSTSWYYDRITRALYVHMVNNDHPDMHVMTIGVINGYSDTEFTPVDGVQTYEGRLLGIPSFGSSRDPLFFGRLTFPSVTFDLANGDGEFDSWAENNDIYGNVARIKHGYADLDYDDYVTLYTGIIEGVAVSETQLSVSVVDRRSQLKKAINYECNSTNALDAIVAILLASYGIPYTSVFYNTTEWAAAQALAPDITIGMDDDETVPVIDLIENICAAVFGFFYQAADGRFSFRIVDTSATSETTIRSHDILEQIALVYDPTEVVSSVKIGYAETASGYSYYTDTSREASVFSAYRTYKEQKLDTYLPTEAAAASLATTILDYTDMVHGTTTVQVPMRYYARSVGETVDVELSRNGRDIPGTKKAEITAVEYALSRPGIDFGLRFV